jgi:antitoxin Phd
MSGRKSKHTWSVQDAKNKFSELVDAARRAPQTVTKHGTPAVVVIDATEYDRLQRLGRAQAPSLAEVLLEMPRDDGDFPREVVRMRDIEF